MNEENFTFPVTLHDDQATPERDTVTVYSMSQLVTVLGWPRDFLEATDVEGRPLDVERLTTKAYMWQVRRRLRHRRYWHIGAWVAIILFLLIIVPHLMY